jgi:ribosome biogenesis GTPase
MTRDRALGWTPELEQAYLGLEIAAEPARVLRIDRGWSLIARAAEDPDPARVRNLGADVAVGDWVIDDGERVTAIVPRHSAFVRRASFEGTRFESQTLAANIDVVALVHAYGTPPNPRRLERELVLAFDSGAEPIIVLTKVDLTTDPDQLSDLMAVAGEVPMLVTSARSGVGIDALRDFAAPHRTIAFLGASGVGKSTLINVLVGDDVQATQEVRAGDQRGRHTTVAASLIRLPDSGWLLDTPGVRALSLWLSGDGIERAFADVFALMDHCRFRNCKHDQEPGCAVLAAIEAGQVSAARWYSLERLVAEEAALEAEQQQYLRRGDRRR